MHEQIRSYALMKISHKSNFSVAFSYVLQSFMSAYNFLELCIAVLKNWTGMLRFLLMKSNSHSNDFFRFM